MRYADMRGMTSERATLLDKKRLGKNQKARVAQLTTQLDEATQPPATPPRNNTGLGADGQSTCDRQGNVYVIRSNKAASLREMRRANKSGRGGIQPFRSRIQRQRRRQKTGGVR